MDSAEVGLGLCWRSAAEDNFAAGELLMDDYARSAVSRFYYAAYAACCAWLEAGGPVPRQTTARGDVWFSHEQLPASLALSAEGLFDERWRLPDDDLRELKRRVRSLCDARVDADYHPDLPKSADDAAAAHTAAAYVLNLLGQPSAQPRSG